MLFIARIHCPWIECHRARGRDDASEPSRRSWAGGRTRFRASKSNRIALRRSQINFGRLKNVSGNYTSSHVRWDSIPTKKPPKFPSRNVARAELKCSISMQLHVDDDVPLKKGARECRASFRCCIIIAREKRPFFISLSRRGRVSHSSPLNQNSQHVTETL